MKKILLGVLVTFFTLHADDIQRLESIVEDIGKLRQSYEKCQAELEKSKNGAVTTEINACEKCEDSLKEYKRLLKDEKEKNALLLAELEGNNKTKKSYKDKEIESLEKQIIKYKNLILSKDEEIKKLEKKNSTYKEIAQKDLDNQILKSNEKVLVVDMEAATYRLTCESDIYDFVNGKVVDHWDAERSFTSNKGAKGWIKITGYFVDKKWQKAEKELWIKSSDILKR